MEVLWSALLSNTALDVLTDVTGQKREIRSINPRKRTLKISVFADDMI